MYDYHMLVNGLMTGSVLFVLGVAGLLVRRSMVVMILSMGVMTLGTLLTLSAFAHFRGDVGGHALALFVLVIASIEATTVLSIANRHRIEEPDVGRRAAGDLPDSGDDHDPHE